MLIKTASGERTESHPPAANTHMPLIEEFVTAVQNGIAPAVDGETGRHVAALIDQIYAKNVNEKFIGQGQFST
jgi:predicted dehydrogenase